MEGGIVKQAFIDKQNYINKKQTELQDDIDASVDIITKINSDTIKSTKELKVAMMSALVDWGGVVTSVGQSFYANDYTVDDILEDSFDFTELCSGNNWHVSYRSWGTSNSTKTQSSNFIEICSQYYQRYRYLQIYEKDQLSTHQKEIERKKKPRVNCLAGRYKS